MDTDSDAGPTIKLISRVGDAFELPYKAASLSQTVKDALGVEDDENEHSDDVEIVKVDTPCLEKVVEFLKHYQKDPLNEIKTPLEGNTFEDVVKQTWYQEFVKGVDQPMLFDLVTAANFMAIQPLLDLTCLQVSCQLMGKSAEEIRVILNIPKLTPEEEAKAREDHRWIFDD
mmetsp:Transcript_5838/g.10530  ORF Transcript_5838/g.10530 Transcript_5838/m.10530 type:complete len:172 (-) Transcript_5838:248-763(-)|eukprot:CAMPEP_0183702788 /NCGR_PEP_ID=MMETSP0737-20130205/783_1 /TAXON_ID=385413 /ORGANISM="Thalassiosira miniscula, Strain CCMP1093" /LENGTH=171 /DNA_ID=CAMNT_0025929463 /DNA_START=69 /DNA_END=584 /DNA_ORIENTATION=-